MSFAARATPSSATRSRQGAIVRTPWRPQPSTSSASVHWLIVIWLKLSRSSVSGAEAAAAFT